MSSLIWSGSGNCSFLNLGGDELYYECPSELGSGGDGVLYCVGHILVGVALQEVMQLPQCKCIQYLDVNQSPEHLQPPPLLPSGHEVVDEMLVKHIYTRAWTNARSRFSQRQSCLLVFHCGFYIFCPMRDLFISDCKMRCKTNYHTHC